MIETNKIDIILSCDVCGKSGDGCVNIVDANKHESTTLCEKCLKKIVSNSKKKNAGYIIATITINTIFAIFMAMMILAATSLLIRLYQYLF